MDSTQIRHYKKTRQPLVSTKPVRKHINALREQGATMGSIAAATGIHYQTLQRIMGSRSKCYTQTAEAILNCRPDTVNTRAFIDATGSRRRLQALMAMGWTKAQMADHMGIKPDTVTEIINDQPTVTPPVAAKIKAGFSVMQMTFPAPGRAATYTQRWAAKRGWMLPFMWDEDEIDNPKARPRNPEYYVQRRTR